MIKTKIILTTCFFLALTATAHSAGYDFYVNANSTESTEDGTEARPWKTITAAMSHIRSGGLKGKSIFVKKGTYVEAVELVNDTNLFGEDRHETIVNGESQSDAIHFKGTKSSISNLTIENGDTNLKISKYSKVTVDNCSVKNSKANGVNVNKSSSKEKYKFTFRNSSVKDSGKRGMYVSRRKIEITGSEFSTNEEEGIDLHTGVKGKISSNTMENNGESGIEMMIADASLSLKGNRITGNHAQGLSVQFYDSRRGTVKATKNILKNNHAFGLRYARYDHGKIKEKFRSFIKKCVKLSGNSISGNGDGDFGYQ